MGLQDRLTELGHRADRQVRVLWERHEVGLLSRDEFIAAAAAVIAAWQSRAVSTADVAVAATIARQLGRPTSPAGLDVPDDRDRLTGAVRTVLDDRPATVEDDDLSRSRSDRLARLARAETLSAGQTATQTAWAAAGLFTGWVRSLDADPCPLCVGWADGVRRPWAVPMARHPGCECLPVPA